MYDLKDEDIYASVNTSAPSSTTGQLPVLELLKVRQHATDFGSLNCSHIKHYTSLFAVVYIVWKFIDNFVAIGAIFHCEYSTLISYSMHFWDFKC